MTEQLPVAHAARFSPDKQVRFLEALALWGSVRAACRAVPAAPQTVYRHRRGSKDFALAWDAAMVVARPRVEEVLGDRALNGVEEIVYYHGEEIGRRRRYDSRLLLAHLGRLDKADDSHAVHDVAHDFDAALARLRRGEPVDPCVDEDADADEPVDYGAKWQDERLPFPERVALYQRWLDEADEDADEDDDWNADDDDPDETEEEAEAREREEDPLGLSASDVALIGEHDDMAALDAIIAQVGPEAWAAQGHAARLAAYKAEAAREVQAPAAEPQTDGEENPSRDSVTPVTLPEPKPPVAPCYVVPPEAAIARELREEEQRQWRPWRPIMDGRCSRYVGRG